jgi:hypothetical protein
MRRTIFMALLAALLFAVPAQAADPIKVIRDCEDDGILQGNYTPAEIRAAQKALPTDIDEYSDCRDVLSRALGGGENDKASGSDSGGNPGATGGSNNGGGSGSPSPTGQPQETGTPDVGDRGTGSVPMLQKPEDWEAVATAAANGDKAVESAAGPLSPGSTRLAASVGRNSLPDTLAVSLVLLVAAFLAAGVPFVRRRVHARRQP